MVFAGQSGFYLPPLVMRTYAPVLPNGPWIRSEYCVNPSQVGPQLRLLKELPATKPKSILHLFGYSVRLRPAPEPRQCAAICVVSGRRGATRQIPRHASFSIR